MATCRRCRSTFRRPILFYNKDAFRKAKLDPEKAPKTWYEMPKAMGPLVDAGYECVYNHHLASLDTDRDISAWHNQDFATKDNGFAGLDAALMFQHSPDDPPRVLPCVLGARRLFHLQRAHR